MGTPLLRLPFWLWPFCFWLAFSCCETAPEDPVPGAADPPKKDLFPEEPQEIPQDPSIAHLDTAASYLGVVEETENWGPDIARFLASVGFNVPVSWCAAFVSYCLDAGQVSSPRTRSALASDFISSGSMKASHVLLGLKEPARGDLVIWRRGNGIFGHIGFVTDWQGECGQTIEGNTTSPDGQQPEGVWEKNRCIQPGSFFRIVSFTPVNP